MGLREPRVAAALVMLLAALAHFSGLPSHCHGKSTTSSTTRPPLPLPPLPTASQMKWQRREVVTFFHFGMNTFTDSEWGTGREDPAVFDPGASLDAAQWVEDGAKAAGASLAILVAKHHDGFCLWPSAYTDHSVAKSPWKNGKGDVVREFVDAARAKGVDVGLYLSPWDRHEKSYGKEREYNEYYLAQLQELLTGYGNVSEIWFDGAKGKNAKKMNYYFQDWFQLTKQLQGSINIFSDAGPDIRWVGDENGYAGSTCWSTVNRDKLKIGDASLANYLTSGDRDGSDWVPPECDVSIRKGWFWHKNETAKPLRQLLDIYYKSVGRNCVLLLNIPPNSSGLISTADTRRLHDFRRAVTTIFANDLARNATASASSERGHRFSAANVLLGDANDDGAYWAPEEEVDGDSERREHWVELRWAPGKEVEFNVVRIQEPVWMGQRVERHEVYADGVMVASGTTVGYKRLHRLRKAVRARRLRVRLFKWRRGNGRAGRGGPLIAAFGVHYDPYWEGKWGTYEATIHPAD